MKIESSSIWHLFTTDVNNNTVTVCNICDCKLSHGNNPKSFSNGMNYKLYSSTLYSSGRISHLPSGTIRSQLDTKNAIWCIPRENQENQDGNGNSHKNGDGSSHTNNAS